MPQYQPASEPTARVPASGPQIAGRWRCWRRTGGSCPGWRSPRAENLRGVVCAGDGDGTGEGAQAQADSAGKEACVRWRSRQDAWSSRRLVHLQAHPLLPSPLP
eukprot:1597074-Rhodomonas_salina.1